MKDLKEKIPSEFYRGEEESPRAANVGELIEQLKRLPPDLVINQGWANACKLTVYNISRFDPHLCIGGVDE